MAGYAVWL